MSLAKRSLIGLIVLAYLIYMLGVFLSYSIPELLDDPPVIEITVSTVGLIVVAVAIDRIVQ